MPKLFDMYNTFINEEEEKRVFPLSPTLYP